ncbi:MAG: helicase RepA family protein, partial [Pseudomonadota bacterium]
MRIRAAIRNVADIKPVLDIKYLVKGWLSEGALSVLYGPSNAGKTFVALSFASHVATGKPWFGCKVAKQNVLYLALEGGTGFDNRIAAAKQHLPELEKARSLTTINAPLDLYEPQGIDDLCDALPNEAFGLIVVDTLARAIAGADENTARDMGQFVGNLDRLREITGAHVLVVHHSGKNEDAGARGSSALKAAVDTELSLTSERELKAAKQRDMEIPEPIYLQLEGVTLGMSAEGDPVTSAVAVLSDGPSKRAKPLKGRNEVGMQALCEALRKHGQRLSGENYPGNRDCVHIDHWRAECREKGLTDQSASSDAQRKAFARVKDALLNDDHIRIQGDYVWR